MPASISASAQTPPATGDAPALVLDPPARTHREILDQIPDLAAMAVALEVPASEINRWIKACRIPRKHWPWLEARGLARPGELKATRPRRGHAAGAVKRKPIKPKAAANKPLNSGSAQAARYSLTAFAHSIDVPGVGLQRSGARPKLADHHRYWLKVLERVEKGELQRVMCFMPPGSAKSTYAVDVFTPWFLGKVENRSVLMVTYASDLATRRGRKARSVARQAAFQQVFGVAPLKSHAGAGDWALDNGGEWMGAGILAGITGNRADLIVIDDPVKGRNEAESPQIRRRTREEFDDTVRTRLKAGGRIVLIQTRWHEDDLAGSLLPQDYDGRSGPVECRDGEVWEVVNIPARAEREDDPLGRKPGAYLWPEYWSEKHWRQFQANPRTWNALYQQRPRPEEGAYFERSAFRRFEDRMLPRSLRYYGTSDYAVSDGRGDYTRLVVWGVDEAMNLWRVGAWGGQTTADVWIEQQCDLIEQFRRRGGIRKWFGEAGVIQRAVEPMLKAKLRERRLSCPLDWLASSADKSSRARSAQSLVREGRVWVRDDGDGDCFIEECVAFPTGRHDDEVDCLSLIGRVIDQLTPPIPHWRPLPEFADCGSISEPGVNRGFGPAEYADCGSVFGDD